MRPRARWLAAAVVLASCSRSAAPPSATPTPADHRARLIAVEGDVRVKRSTASDYETALKGTVLSIADLVSTGPSGHATIAFDDGSTAMVTPHSLVAIEPPATSAANGIKVQNGRVDLEISSSHTGQFRVRTPDADTIPAREIDVVKR